MPVSKRNRVVSLTQAKKKGLEHKEKLVNEVRNGIEKYDSVYIFSVENMRNNKLKSVREEWKGTSKLIMGKNKVLQIALGRSAENEIADNIHKVSERLLGQCGLLLTSEPESDVIEWFKSYREPDFARSGFVATETVVLTEDDLSDFSHAMEPQFRRLGLPTKLVDGKIKLLQDFTVCSKGDTLTPEMADVLKLKGIQMAEFHVTLECLWRKDGTFKVLHEKKERSSKEVKKSKAKRNKAKRPKRMRSTTEGGDHEAQDAVGDDDDEEDDDDDDENGNDSDEDLDDEAMEEVGEDEEEKTPPKSASKDSKTNKQKENRLFKKAKRSIQTDTKAKATTDDSPISQTRTTRRSKKAS